MGQFDLIQPLVETVDRRGQNYELGRAGANTSELGAFIEGFTQTAANVTNIRTAQLDAQVRFDPDRLADEAVKRDLINEQLSEAIEGARINNNIQRETGLEAAEASIQEAQARARLNSQNANKVATQVDILEKTGVEAARAKISLDRSTAAQRSADAFNTTVEAQLERQFGGLTRRAEAISKAGKGFKDLAQATGDIPTGSGGRASAGGAAGGGGSFSDFSDLNLSGDATTAPVEQQNFSQVPSVGPAQSARTLSPVQQAAQSFATEVSRGQELEQQGSVELDTSAQRLANDKLQKENAVTRLGERYLLEGRQAAADVVEGPPNVSAGLPAIAKMSSLIEQSQNPKQQQVLGAQLGTLIDEFGGADELLANLDEEIKDPEQLSKIKGSIYKALAKGDPAKLPSEQKDVLAAFSKLGPDAAVKFIENPEAVYEDVAKLIGGNANQIKDSDFKRAMRDNEYIIAANKATKNGQQPFKVIADRIEGGGDAGPDIASAQGGASQKVMRIEGADGSSAVAPPPQSDEDYAVLNILDEVSKRAGAATESGKQAQATTGQIAQRNQAVTAPAQEGGIAAGVPAPVAEVTPTEQAAVSQQADVATPANVQGADIVQPGAQPDASQAPLGAPNQGPALQPGESQYAAPAQAPAKPLVSDQEIAQKTVANDTRTQAGRIQQGTGLDDKSAAIRAEKEVAAQQKFTKKLQDEIIEDDTQANTNSRRANIINQMIDIMEEEGITDFAGAGGQFDRFAANFSGKLPTGLFSSDAKRRLIELGDALEGGSVLEMVQGGIQGQVINTPEERKGLTAFAGSLNNGIADLKQVKDFVETEAETTRGINRVKEELIGLGVRDFEANRIINQYAREYGRRKIFSQNGKLKDNPNFLSADEYLNNIPLIKELNNRRNQNQSGDAEAQALRDAIAAKRGFKNGEAVSTQGAGSPTQVPLGEPPTGGGSSGPSPEPTPVPTQAEVENIQAQVADDKTTTKQIRKQLPPGLFFEQSFIPEAEIQQNLDKIKQVTDQKAQAGEETALNIEQLMLEDPKLKAQIDATVQAVAKERGDGFFSVANLDYIADSFLFNKGDEIVEWINTRIGGMDPKQAAILKSISEKTRAEFAKGNPKTAVASDIIAIVGPALTGAGLVKAGAQGAANVAAKTGVKVATRTGAAEAIGTGLTRAGLKEGTAQAIGRGAVATGIKGAEIGGFAAVDGAIGALRQDGDEFLSSDKFKQDAAISAGIQTVLGAAGRAVGPAMKLVREAAQGAKAPEALAEAFKRFGVSRETIIEALEESKRLSSQADNVNIPATGTLPRDAQNIAEAVVSSEGARPVVAQQGAQLASAVRGTRAAAEDVAGLSALESADQISKRFDDVVTQKITEQTEKGIAKGNVLRDKKVTGAITKAINNRESSPAVVEKLVRDISEAAGVKAPKVGAARAGGDAGQTLLNNIDNLQQVRESIDDTIQPAFESLERQFAEGFGEGEVRNLASDVNDALVTRFGPRFQNIIDDVGAKLQGAEFGGVQGEFAGEIPNNFKFLAELREVIKKGGNGITEVGKDQSDAAVKLIDDTINDAFEQVGKGKNFWSNPVTGKARGDLNQGSGFINKYGTLRELGKRVEKQGEILEEVYNQTQKGDVPVKDLIFGSAAKRREVEYAFGGRKAAQQFEKQLGAVDEVTEVLADLGKGDLSNKQLARLSENLGVAGKLVGDTRFAEKIIKDGSNKTINALQKEFARNPEAKKTMVDGALRFVADKIGDLKPGALAGKEATVAQAIGLKPSEFNRVKALVGKESADLMEVFLGRKVALDNIDNIAQTTPEGIAREISRVTGATIDNISGRRLIETRGLIGFDLIANKVITSAEKKTQRNIAKMLLDPDPAKVNQYLKEVTDIMAKGAEEVRPRAFNMTSRASATRPTTAAGTLAEGAKVMAKTAGDAVVGQARLAAQNKARALLWTMWATTEGKEKGANRQAIRDRKAAMQALNEAQ